MGKEVMLRIGTWAYWLKQWILFNVVMVDPQHSKVTQWHMPLPVGPYVTSALLAFSPFASCLLCGLDGLRQLSFFHVF